MLKIEGAKLKKLQKILTGSDLSYGIKRKFGNFLQDATSVEYDEEKLVAIAHKSEGDDYEIDFKSRDYISLFPRFLEAMENTQ